MSSFSHLPLEATKAILKGDVPTGMQARLRARQRDLGFVDLAWAPVDGGYEIRKIGPAETDGCDSTDAISLEPLANGDIVYRQADTTDCINEKHLETWRATGRNTWPLRSGVPLPPRRPTYGQDPAADGLRVPALALTLFHTLAAATDARFVITRLGNPQDRTIDRYGWDHSSAARELLRRIKRAGGIDNVYLDGRLAVGRWNLPILTDMLREDHTLAATIHAVRPPGYELTDNPADKLVLYYGKANHPPTGTTNGLLVGRHTA